MGRPITGYKLPSAQRSGLLLSVLSGALAASLVGVLLIKVLPGGSGSIDQTLPQTGPLGNLISTIVPLVWVALFSGLGAAFWLVSGGGNDPRRARWAVLGLVGLCMVYPVLASGVSQLSIAIVGNGVTIACALLTARLCWPVSRLASLFPSLVALWVGLATAGLVALMLGLPY
ncbi:tryptophan-rich sensory protein [Cyanobium sp. Morenito 9A2]|uniref:tryptophan-rich sensory protein n=1 Tax=Cyanobium sp. Morenito 9A2 TaxID=2823718 RepID=UPI0020CD767F|nr:tryptophan-rich sensory protein [Cyanobium sp. Morenito 9A2]MCP9850383.1 tryptophan-rich sensory protein [Cyanobium sp. Morenito 9A2]